jgi:hypothetical protein
MPPVPGFVSIEIVISIIITPVPGYYFEGNYSPQTN